jgi:hypothetical protein
MDEKLMMAQEELKAKLQDIAISRSADGLFAFAQIANMPYDAELPIPSIISKVAKVARVEMGEDYEYFAIDMETKTVFTIENGAVTQVPITIDTPNDAVFSSYNGPAEYVYVEKLMEAKYDPIAVKGKAIMEALNRKETKDVLDVLIASATSKSNLFTLDSGATRLTFAKCEEIVRSLELYGSRIVVIAGSSVASDLRLMNYNEDKNQAVKLSDLGIVEVVTVAPFTYAHSGTQTVLASDKAIFVALNDSMDEAPVHFVRRKIKDVFNGGNDKERIIVASGPRLQVAENPKWAYEIAVMEQYAVVQPNPYPVAVFTKA